MPDLLGELRASLEKRLRELEPIVKEHAQIREALDRLAGAIAPARRAAAPESGAATRKRTAPATARRGRPRGTGGRAAEALKIVQDQPGVTIGEMAKKLGISPNYLYRVLPQLEADKKVKKQGKGYHPA